MSDVFEDVDGPDGEAAALRAELERVTAERDHALARLASGGSAPVLAGTASPDGPGDGLGGRPMPELPPEAALAQSEDAFWSALERADIERAHAEQRAEAEREASFQPSPEALAAVSAAASADEFWAAAEAAGLVND